MKQHRRPEGLTGSLCAIGHLSVSSPEGELGSTKCRRDGLLPDGAVRLVMKLLPPEPRAGRGPYTSCVVTHSGEDFKHRAAFHGSYQQHERSAPPYKTHQRGMNRSRAPQHKVNTGPDKTTVIHQWTAHKQPAPPAVTTVVVPWRPGNREAMSRRRRGRGEHRIKRAPTRKEEQVGSSRTNRCICTCVRQ